MKQVLEFLGAIAFLQGAVGLIHEFTDWDIGLIQRLDFLDGYEIYASIAQLVLSIALFAVAESLKSG
ncbi:hypothetical protein [Streptomyces sp. NPDC048825]|uniref:hypothetical protein n=1 Tax=Streptomyces sp. NPDC048825 TaxID=3365592 RepID=UPI00371C859C